MTINRRDVLKASSAAFASQYLCEWAPPAVRAAERHPERKYEGPLITGEELHAATIEGALVCFGPPQDAFGVHWAEPVQETAICGACSNTLFHLQNFEGAPNWEMAYREVANYIRRSPQALVAHDGTGAGLVHNRFIASQLDYSTACRRLKPVIWRRKQLNGPPGWPAPDPTVLLRLKSAQSYGGFLYFADRDNVALMLAHQLKNRSWRLRKWILEPCQFLTQIRVYQQLDPQRGGYGDYRLDLDDLTQPQRRQFDAILLAYVTLGGFEPDGELRWAWGVTNSARTHRSIEPPWPLTT